MEKTYIALDIETTGLDAKWDKVVEIGAVRVVDGAETGTFQTLVNPRRSLSPTAAKLTGITDEELEKAPDIGEIFRDFLEFCGELPVLGHHIIFDYSFLKRAAVNHGYTFERRGIDTLALCRKFMPEQEKKNLEAACAFYGVRRQGAHRALGDARDAHGLYQALMRSHGTDCPEAFLGKPLIYKVKKEQPASEKQKQDLRDLLKYHKINVLVQIDALSRNEASRMKDKIISQYGRYRG